VKGYSWGCVGLLTESRNRCVLNPFVWADSCFYGDFVKRNVDFIGYIGLPHCFDCLTDDCFCRFNTIPACDRQTDRRPGSFDSFTVHL